MVETPVRVYAYIGAVRTNYRCRGKQLLIQLEELNKITKSEDNRFLVTSTTF